MPDQQNDDLQPRRVEMDLAELIPPNWHDSPVWISSYRAFGLPASALHATEPFDLLGVRGQLFWGAPPIWSSALNLQPQADGGVVAELNVEGVQHASDGPYLMLMTPTEWGTAPGAEEATRRQLRSVVALLCRALGRNIAVEPLGELIFTASTSNVNAVEPGFRPPTFDPAPDLSPDRLRLVSDIDQAVDLLDEDLRNRVELSLQWFHLRNSAGHPGPMIDIRGEGGYVVAAGSHLHGRTGDSSAEPSTLGYRLVDDRAPAELPGWLTTAIGGDRQRDDSPAAAGSPIENGRRQSLASRSQGYGAAALRAEVDRVRSAPVGQRNHTLNAAAYSLGQLVAADALDQQRTVDALSAAAEAAGLEHAEIAATMTQLSRSNLNAVLPLEPSFLNSRWP